VHAIDVVGVIVRKNDCGYNAVGGRDVAHESIKVLEVVRPRVNNHNGCGVGLA
jgi:hypothetical protein